MTRYPRLIGRRLLQAVPTIFGVIVLCFLLLKLIPGDLVDALMANLQASNPEYEAALRAKLGLDQPVIVQLLLYIWSVLKLDLGFSYSYTKPVATVVLEHLGPTLILMVSSIFTAAVLAVVLGVAAARRANSLLDNIITVVALLFYAMPVFWIGLMMIVLFSVMLGVLPVGGFQTIGVDFSLFGKMIDVLRHLAMPMATLSLFFMAVYTRLMRTSMLEIYGLDFVRTARAKGLAEGRIAYRHVLRNALMPLVTMVGLQLGAVLGGAVVVETVFSWPGIGRLAYDAVFQRDYPLLLAILMLSATLVVIVNLLVDLLYAWLDPRIEAR